MQKIVLSLVLVAGSLLSKEVDGYQVYQKNCKVCHIEMITKEETLKRFQTLKAPPMVEVSKQLKYNIVTRDDDEEVKRRVVIAFVKEYIQKPNIDYAMCNPGAIDRFEIMPSLQGRLSEAEREAVATWLYDRYEGVKF